MFYCWFSSTAVSWWFVVMSLKLARCKSEQVNRGCATFDHIEKKGLREVRTQMSVHRSVQNDCLHDYAQNRCQTNVTIGYVLFGEGWRSAQWTGRRLCCGNLKGHKYVMRGLAYPRRQPTCRASSQWSHTISRTPCHGAWTSAPLCAHPYHRVLLHDASNRDTHLYPQHSNSSASLTTYVRRSGWIINGTRSGRTNTQDSAF